MLRTSEPRHFILHETYVWYCCCYAHGSHFEVPTVPTQKGLPRSALHLVLVHIPSVQNRQRTTFSYLALYHDRGSDPYSGLPHFENIIFRKELKEMTLQPLTGICDQLPALHEDQSQQAAQSQGVSCLGTLPKPWNFTARQGEQILGGGTTGICDWARAHGGFADSWGFLKKGGP